MYSVALDKNNKDIKEIRRLYNASFPADERIPFSILLKTVTTERLMFVYYDEEKLVGMSSVYLKDDMVYLSYVTVEESLRDHGYGTEILDLTKKQFQNCRIVVDIEVLDESSDNYAERVRRKDFYLRNGFVSCDVYYSYNDIEYEILSYNGLLTRQDWHGIIQKHWGKYADYAVYRNE